MTNVTTDMVHWYEMNEPEDQQSKDNLVQSVETIATVGEYTTTTENGQLFVAGSSSGTLKLVSDKAKARFLQYVRDSKVPDDTELDFQRAMEDSKS
jgi:hypothetical protein